VAAEGSTPIHRLGCRWVCTRILHLILSLFSCQISWSSDVQIQLTYFLLCCPSRSLLVFLCLNCPQCSNIVLCMVVDFFQCLNHLSWLFWLLKHSVSSRSSLLWMNSFRNFWITETPKTPSLIFSFHYFCSMSNTLNHTRLPESQGPHTPGFESSAICCETSISCWVCWPELLLIPFSHFCLPLSDYKKSSTCSIASSSMCFSYQLSCLCFLFTY